MTKTNKKKFKRQGSADLIAFPIIKAATTGDIDAINTVLKHYEGYITALSARKLYDEYGNPHLCVDEEIRCRLQTKLITKILSFKIA